MSDKKIYDESLFLHEKLRGKIGMYNKLDIYDADDLALVYSPGVAAPCRAIHERPEDVWKYTMKRNTVAIVTDGSAVLGLGNIGPAAALPVMEGKAMLFKKFARINGIPICLDTQDTDEIVATVRRIAPVFGGINLEDIAAPRSFEVETALQDLGIPVFHDDQHGTAIVVLAALINACKLLKRNIFDLKVVINGSGAAGVAIARMLRCHNLDASACIAVRDVVMVDSKGIIHSERTDLNPVKREMLSYTNRENRAGSLRYALRDADVFIGVSVGDLLHSEDIRTMAPDPIIFALANPTPEIMPEAARAGGAAIVATGRSDFPNQVNNVLGFPGIFRGALDAQASRIDGDMKLAAANALARVVRSDELQVDYIIPSSLNEKVAFVVAQAVQKAAERTH